MNNNNNNANSGDGGGGGGEYKDDYEIGDMEPNNLAPINDMDQWVYVEDISLDYSFAQSVLFKITGGSIQETGHKTKGHACLTDSDKYVFCYAIVLPFFLVCGSLCLSLDLLLPACIL